MLKKRGSNNFFIFKQVVRKDPTQSHQLNVKNLEEQDSLANKLPLCFKTISENSLNPYMCSFCGLCVNDVVVAKLHYLTKHTRSGKITYCKLCSYFSNRADSLKKHMKSHEGSDIYQCFECNFISVTKEKLSTHTQKVHKKTAMFCPRCNFSTWDLGSLKEHSIEFHDLDFIHCNMCSFFPTGEDEYDLKHSLSIHLKNAHNVNFNFKL